MAETKRNQIEIGRSAKVLSVISVVAIAAGAAFAMPLASAHNSAAATGTAAVAWGNGSEGQLGTGKARLTPATSPVGVLGLGNSTVRGLAAGSAHSLAVLSNGRVLSWGLNDEGELGNGGFGTNGLAPGVVVGPGGNGELNNVTAAAAGNVTSTVLRSDGTVWAWGDNIWGQLGQANPSGPQRCPTGSNSTPANDKCSTIPVPVVGPDGTGRLDHILAIGGAEENGLALKVGGSVYAWGLNDEGQLGIGNSTGPQKCQPYTNYAAVGCSSKPVRVVGLDGKGFLNHVVALAGGESFNLALKSDGTVRAWGTDRFANLGQLKPTGETCLVPFFGSPTPCSTKPVAVVGPNGKGHLSGIVAIAANPSPNGLHALALRSDGTVWAWGVDDMGQLGDGVSKEFSNLPVEVVGPGGRGYLTHVVAIAAGGKFSYALRSDGTLWAWGMNDQGQLGTGKATGPDTCTTDNVPCSTVPVQVVGMKSVGKLRGATTLAAGEAHVLALINPVH